MKQEFADALLDFYQKILKPEFDAIKEKLAAHDEQFSQAIGHLDSIYNRIGILEDDSLTINDRLGRIEEPAEPV